MGTSLLHGVVENQIKFLPMKIIIAVHETIRFRHLEDTLKQLSCISDIERLGICGELFAEDIVISYLVKNCFRRGLVSVSY